jgi:hypothetical protein
VPRTMAKEKKEVENKKTRKKKGEASYLHAT